MSILATSVCIVHNVMICAYNNIMTHYDVTMDIPSNIITYCDVIIDHGTKK